MAKMAVRQDGDLRNDGVRDTNACRGALDPALTRLEQALHAVPPGDLSGPVDMDHLVSMMRVWLDA